MSHSITRLRSAVVVLLLSTSLVGQVLPIPPVDHAPPVKIIATLPTYASLATAIGGELVDVVTLCRPGQDLHAVAPTPSLMARAQNADLALHTGLDAEPWLEPMLRSTGNTQLLPGQPLSLSLSDGVPLKQVPAVLTRAAGDLHAFGNTHVWTDPYAVRGMAERVRDALVALLPEHADAIRARHAAFHTRLTQALVGWLTRFRGLSDRNVVVFHDSWVYLFERFGIERVGTLEPKPRVAPTAAHLDQLVTAMHARGVTLVVREPYQFPEAADHVAERTGATVLVLSTHPGWPEGTEDVIDHFEHNLSALAAALEQREERDG